MVELDDRLSLPADIRAAANPKSSTGRIDVFTRVIADRARRFDTIERASLRRGVAPHLPVRVRTGSRLSQIRFACGDARLDDAGHRALHAAEPWWQGPSR